MSPRTCTCKCGCRITLLAIEKARVEMRKAIVCLACGVLFAPRRLKAR